MTRDVEERQVLGNFSTEKNCNSHSQNLERSDKEMIWVILCHLPDNERKEQKA